MMAHMNELEAVISEDVCWRQIKMTCDTENPKLEEDFNYFFLQIQPKLQPYADKLNRKLIGSPFTAELDQSKYFTYLRSVKRASNSIAKQIFPCFLNSALCNSNTV
jgi:oligoendopeptidase F